MSNDRPRYRTVVDTNEDGTIRCVITSLQPPAEGDSWVEITDDPMMRRASNFPRDHLVDRRRRKVRAKPLVKLVADQEKFPADGQTVVRVRIEGLPEEYDEVKVRVRGEEGTLVRGEDIEITASRPTMIKIEVVTRTLKARPLFLLAQPTRPDPPRQAP